MTDPERAMLLTDLKADVNTGLAGGEYFPYQYGGYGLDRVQLSILGRKAHAIGVRMATKIEELLPKPTPESPGGV